MDRKGSMFSSTEVVNIGARFHTTPELVEIAKQSAILGSPKTTFSYRPFSGSKISYFGTTSRPDFFPLAGQN